MSDSFTIQLGRGRALALTACLIGAAVLLFIAGTATGLLVASQSVAEDSVEATHKSEKTPPAATQERPAERESSADVLNSSTERDPDASGPNVQPKDPAPTVNEPPPLQRNSASGSDSNAAVAPIASAKSVSETPTKNQAVETGSSVEGSEETNRIPLAVNVCSFASKASADKMIASLAEHGYQASLAHSTGADGRSWYVVKLGPYTEWDTASTVAAKVAIAENVRPTVGPLR